MPGLAHAIYGFAIGLILMWATENKFTIQHVIVFGVNNWIGPDIGATIWYFTRGMNDDFSRFIIFFIHNPYMFPLTLGLPLAFVWRRATRLTTQIINGKIKIIRTKKYELSVAKCFMLITAGSYSHFLLDYLFETDGNTVVYRWVIDTGYWVDPYIDIWIIIPVLLTTLFVLLFIKVNNPPNENDHKPHLRKSAIVLSMYTIIYLIYLGIRLQYPVPAISEEADFGVVIFLSIFLFFPLILCVWSTREVDKWKFRLSLKKK